MRYLVLSDLHANLEALEASMAAAAGTYDRILVLGDLVGYGADPNAVIERVRAMPDAIVIRGNHDKVGAGIADMDAFNHIAQQAIIWTAVTLTPGHRDWLAALPSGPVEIDPLAEICHGAPFDEDVYLIDGQDIRRALDASTHPLCLFGHTHVPGVFRRDGDEIFRMGPQRDGFHLRVEESARYLVNVGAVGQPRDGDWRAAFGVLDTETRALTGRRVAYDLKGAQKKIAAAGLPEVLAQRLSIGR
jgi:diadenosine tetraphosphatase ApaH/serine/threonine PP2A family protein phosphatase